MSCPTRGLKLIIIISIGAQLVGCLPQAENHPGQNLYENPGEGNSSKPSVLCGNNRAVTGIDKDGNVVCGAPRLSGMTGKSAYLPCEIDEDDESVLVESGSDHLVVPLCAQKRDESPDDVTLGASPTDEFGCPAGSALYGFSEYGEPLCASVVGSDLDEVALIMPKEECPYGMIDGQIVSPDFTLPACKYENSAGRVHKISGKSVVRFPRQANTHCSGDKVVVGFDQDHRILCDKGPKQFRNRVRSYMTTKFDKTGFPKCKGNYEAQQLALQTVVDRRPVNIWTCVRKSGD